MKKNSLGIFLATLFCAILLPMQVKAERGDGFQVDSTGVVTLRSQHAAKEEISSLQFSLTVDSAEAAKVEFQFEGSNARVMDFRYDENTKKMNVYMAGVNPLFAENTDSLTIGKVVVLDSSGNETDAQVTVEDNSLQYVYGTEVKKMENVELPGTVPIGPSAQATPQPTSEPTPVTPTEPPLNPEQTPPPAQETPQPDDSGKDDDPNAGWDPGWQNPGNNSQGGGNNSTPTQGTGGKKTQTSVRVPHKVASSSTPVPSTSPSPSVSPSPEPENTSEPESDESIGSDAEQTEDDTSISASASAGEQEETGQEETGKKTDWLMIVVVIAIVIFVAVAAIAVVVLKGKKKPHDREV